ncbi:MAG: transposase family protein [Rhodoferax sp.]
MRGSTGTSLIERLRQVPDPRVKRGRRHELMGILAVALRAAIAGADDWVDVVQFGQAKKAWFATFLEFPQRERLARHPRAGVSAPGFQGIGAICINWLQGIAGKAQGVAASDDKTLRRSRDADRSPLNIVSAWACPTTKSTLYRYGPHQRVA